MTAPAFRARLAPAAIRKRLALCLDIAAAAGLIAGTAALLAVVDTHTFDVSRVYVAAVLATAPIVGLLYVAGRWLSAEPTRARPARPPTTTPTGHELRRRLAACLADLVMWFAVLNAVLLPGNLLLALNRWLDRSAPTEEAYVVDGKRYLHKDKRAYFAMTRPGASATDRESVPVSARLYDRIVLDRTKVVFTVHEGALGFRWRRHAELRWSDLDPSL